MSKAVPRLSKAALVAFFLGLTSPSIVTAFPALYLGVQALRSINRSDGRLWGHYLAVAGLVLSAAVLVLCGIGVFVMVLFAVQGKSYLVGCTNSLRLLGQAMQRYHDHNNETFPPGTIRNIALKPEKRLSWQAAVVPLLSEGGRDGKKWETLAGEIALERAWDDADNAALLRNITAFSCPSFAHERKPGQVGLTSYVGIAGLGRDAAVLPLNDPRAGFFGYDRLLHRTDITASLGSTMAATETTRDNGPWLAGGSSTVRGLEMDCPRYLGRGAPFGGLHREGANVLWADGSVHIVTEQIEPNVFRQEARITR